MVGIPLSCWFLDVMCDLVVYRELFYLILVTVSFSPWPVAMTCCDFVLSLWPRHLSLLGVGSLGTLVGLLGDVSALVLTLGGMVRPRIQKLFFLDVRIPGSACRFDFNISVHYMETC